MLVREAAAVPGPFPYEGGLLTFPEGLVIIIHTQLFPAKGFSVDHEGKFWISSTQSTV